MKRIVLVVALAWVSAHVMADEPAPDTSRCGMCHSDPEFFGGKSQGELMAAIKESGERSGHPYTSGLTDEQIRAMAEILRAGK